MASEQPLIWDAVSEEILACAERLAKQKHTQKLTVRSVLREMDITNRVFYNRFHNIDEVLELVYRKMMREVRKSMSLPLQEGTDFFTHVRQVAAQTLIVSYDCKENLSQFVFESDSSSEENFCWWTAEIKKLIAAGQKEGQVAPDLDADSLSYAIWCFIRGFNADAMARSLSREEALRRFDYGFGIFLKGIRA